MKMSIRGLVFALVCRRATVELGAKSRKGVTRESIMQLAQNELRIDAALILKALEWLDAEGYIKLNSKTILVRNAGWELADRYINALKKWYKGRKAKENTSKAA